MLLDSETEVVGLGEDCGIADTDPCKLNTEPGWSLDQTAGLIHTLLVDQKHEQEDDCRPYEFVEVKVSEKLTCWGMA